jgi:hypothetical protein
MGKLADLIVKNVDVGFKATAIAVDQTVVIATPVDTGRARSNWRVQSGEPNTAVRPAFVAGKDGSTLGENTNAAISEGKAIIAADRTGTIYISNNLPYIGPLNDGSSAQAPAGFVERAVQSGLQVVSRIKALAGA